MPCPLRACCSDPMIAPNRDSPDLPPDATKELRWRANQEGYYPLYHDCCGDTFSLGMPIPAQRSTDNPVKGCAPLPAELRTASSENAT